jgi:hypothetical protein
MQSQWSVAPLDPLPLKKVRAKRCKKRKPIRKETNWMNTLLSSKHVHSGRTNQSVEELIRAWNLIYTESDDPTAHSAYAHSITTSSTLSGDLQG